MKSFDVKWVLMGLYVLGVLPEVIEAVETIIFNG